MEDRLTRVEEKIAYLEQFVGELDGVVRELHDGLAAMKREIGGLRERMDRPAEEDDSDDLEAHKPPHY